MRQGFALDALPWQAWKNGAGRTREIAAEPPGAGFDDFGWRISVAEVAHDAPFSAFPGVARCIVLLSGAGLRLRSDDGRLDHTLDRALEPFRFEGEQALRATLVNGACSDFNVMTRRGVWRSELRCLEGPARLPGADALLVLALAGAPAVDGVRLAPGTGCVWRGPCDALSIAAGGTLIAVRLLRESAP